MAENLVTELSNLNEEVALTIVKTRLDAGENPLAILTDVKSAMEIVGKRFEKKEYFIPDLVYSGEILSEITDIVKPQMTGAAASKKQGKVIIGTTEWSAHSTGAIIPEDRPVRVVDSEGVHIVVEEVH